MTVKEFLESKGSDYTLNYPPERKKEVKQWIEEYAELYHESKATKTTDADLKTADVISSVCPICKSEPMIKVNGKYNCEMCGYGEIN